MYLFAGKFTNQAQERQQLRLNSWIYCFIDDFNHEQVFLTMPTQKFFELSFSHFPGKKFFSKNLALSRTTSYRSLISCQNLEKK